MSRVWSGIGNMLVLAWLEPCEVLLGCLEVL
jgi:hypothetical protein